MYLYEISNKFYIGKFNKNYKIWYSGYISEIKFKKSSSKSNFTQHFLEYNHSLYFNIEKHLITIIKANNKM